jgi:dTDP-glucose 4,6-dehydratase
MEGGMNSTNTILVTGGAGFIGSNFVLEWIENMASPVVNLDILSYSGNLNNLKSLDNNERHIFIKGDIGDSSLVENLLSKYRPAAVINFAAESHVDRSIHDPNIFVKTNVMGTCRLLDTTLQYWQKLMGDDKDKFRFLHVSTDEVYGSLGPDDPLFKESKQYEPNSPYSASKAASDHFVRAYYHTYGLPVLTTNCSNNYGPYQFPEKLIPLVITNALDWKALPIYGDGQNIRDWLYVIDHCDAIRTVLENGEIGETYNIGGSNEIKNIDLVRVICKLLDELFPHDKGDYEQLITFVKDRPGHDKRYAIDIEKISTELNWSPSESFDSGIKKTIMWYLSNKEWINTVMSGDYRQWIEVNYSKR